jgi:signal transduction histidine kinase
LLKSAKKYVFWYLYIAAGLLSSSTIFMVYLGDGSNSFYYSGVTLIFLGVGFINSFYYKDNIVFCLSQIVIYNLAMFLSNSHFNFANFCFSNYFLFSTMLFIVLITEFSGSQHLNAFNKEHEMLDTYTKLKETQAQLIQAEKLYAVGQLASGVAHEVRNPLAIILQGVNYLESKLSNTEVDIQETLSVLKESVKRADKIINALLDFSRATILELRPENINNIIESSLSLIRNHLANKNIEITTELKHGIHKVLVDKNRLEQVFINILLNAIQAMPGGGRIIIRSSDKQLWNAKHGIGGKEVDRLQLGKSIVVVEIEDTGEGIPPENLKKVFDPFFTTKGPSGGCGLGLSVTHSIISMHKGLIEIESQPGKGTKVTIVLRAITEGRHDKEKNFNY